MKQLVTTDWLEKNLENVKILDGSWHLPSTERNALNEFNSGHIKKFLICFLKCMTQPKKICNILMWELNIEVKFFMKLIFKK